MKRKVAGKVDLYEDFHPLTRADWRRWLAENHDRAAGVWFVYFKKASGRERVAYAEAVEEALCFGWIDSLPRKIDEHRSKLLFTPRKKKSVWSRPNKERVERLIAEGLMTEAGLAKIEAARNDGSWHALDASDRLEMPPELESALAENDAARENFEGFAASSRRAILSWIYAARRDETRRARVAKTVAMAARNKRANFDRE